VDITTAGRWPIPGENGRITMPILLMGGAQDPLRNVEKISARLSQLQPQLVTRILPNRGHVLVNIAEQIIPFLRSSGGKSNQDINILA